MNKSRIRKIYQIMIRTYQPQGWWPLTDIRKKKSKNILLNRGYHPLDYSVPRSKNQQYEVCVGAILTQNTSWTQVEKALNNLKKDKLLDVDRINKMNLNDLKNTIKPSGYYNQKALKIKEFTKFFINLNGRIPEREVLLNVWGVGPETADSILLYAFKKPFFIVDSYTKRFLSRIFNQKLIDYVFLQSYIHNVYKDMEEEERLKIFNEFHSLIVEHGKKVCKKKADCGICILKNLCEFDLESGDF